MSGIAFDAVSRDNTSWGGGSSSFNFSHTNNGNFLAVATYTYDGSLITVSGITYNSVSMSKIDSISASLEGNRQDVELWGLASAPTGSHTVAVTFSGAPSFANCFGISYTGVATSSPIDSHATSQTGSSVSSYSLATSVVGSGCWLVGALFARPDGTGGVGGTGGTTKRTLNADTPHGNLTADSNGIVGSGSQSLAYGVTGGTSTFTVPGAITASILPAAAPQAGSSLFLFGLGGLISLGGAIGKNRRILRRDLISGRWH